MARGNNTPPEADPTPEGDDTAGEPRPAGSFDTLAGERDPAAPDGPGALAARRNAALNQPTPEPGRPSGYHVPPAGFISEGTAQEIEANGEARDPYTGRRLTIDDLPESRQAAARERLAALDEQG